MISGGARRRGLLLTAFVLAFALGFGLNSSKSNQAVYLLGSVRLLEPGLWARDFLVNSQHYHPVYAWLGALLLRLDPSGWLIGLSNVAAIAAAMWCVYRLLVATLGAGRERDSFVAFLIVLSLAAASGTNGVGGSYVFSDVFQPSTLGALGVLASALELVRGRPLRAGLWLAFAGAFHLNYLVLALPVFGLAWLVGERERPLRGVLLGLGPALPIVLWFVPLLLASGSSGVAEEARRINQDVRAPHHYHVATFASAYLPWLGFQALGVATLLRGGPTPDPQRRRLLALLAGFSALIVPGTLLSLSSRAVSSLFAWRLSPHANLLAQVALAGALAHVLLRPTASVFVTGRLGQAQRALGAFGLLCLLAAALLGVSRTESLMALALVALVLTRSRWQPLLTGGAAGNARLRQLLEVGLPITFACSVASALVHLNRDSDLLGGRDRDVDALCSWLGSNTSADALLLTPPDEEQLRFKCRRAIVVDWKATPVIPAELMEWAQRMEDVTGRHPLRSESDMEGYQALDERRLSELRARYAPDLLVVRQGAAYVPPQPPDYAHGRFRVYRLPATRASGAAERAPAL